jgi:hypothetical protein
VESKKERDDLFSHAMVVTDSLYPSKRSLTCFDHVIESPLGGLEEAATEETFLGGDLLGKGRVQVKPFGRR